MWTLWKNKKHNVIFERSVWMLASIITLKLSQTLLMDWYIRKQIFTLIGGVVWLVFSYEFWNDAKEIQRKYRKLLNS